MTKQIKTIGGRRGFSWLNPRSARSWCALFQIAAVSFFVIRYPSIGAAQGNLADLYNWVDESVPYKGLIDIYTSNSATFVGDYGSNFSDVNQLNLSGNLSTTPGVPYEISFTLQDTGIGDFAGAGNVCFGNSEIILDSTFADGYITNGGYVFPPVNFDFIAVAASSTTSMSFGFALDEGLNADLSNLEITEITPAPEASTNWLVCCGGCVLLLAKQLRRLVQKRNLAVRRIV
ncbi:MAG TPA: hypothetical protein VGY56_09845 [Verrucomicrobiae bacterium]|nr:hypothetical protein [Verrucomicrobiae bacterium]